MAKRRRSLGVGNIPSSQMVYKKLQLLGPDKLAKFDIYQESIWSRTWHNQELCEFEERLLSENNNADEDYKGLLLSLISKSKRAEPHKSRRRKDDNAPDRENSSCDKAVDVSESYSDCCSSDDEIDPSCRFFFSKLKRNETSYVLEDERNGEQILITYEGDSCSDKDCGCLDEECGKQPMRKLRSAMKKQKDGASNDIKQSTRGKSRNKVKSEKIENVECSTSGKVPESDFRFFLKHCKYVDGSRVYAYGGDTVVYEKSKEDNNTNNNNNSKEIEDDDACSSDVEIIDSITFYNEKSSSPSKMNNEKYGSLIVESEFRHKLIGILRRPFEQEEYDKLWIEAEQRKPELHHKDLRGGNIRWSISTNIDGKSYLDHHPDLGRKLLLYQDDKPRCLNLLRGFFFWLQNIQQDGSFQPWQDEKCLAIKPESC